MGCSHPTRYQLLQRQNALMSQLKDLISNEMGKVQDQQQRIAETQITKIEATLSDGHKFKRRGCTPWNGARNDSTCAS
jgi:hypothetical protein